MAGPKKTAEDQKPTIQAVAPKTVYRDQVQIDHHLFKGEVAKCIKRDKFGPIPFLQIEHVHFFHSVNSAGQKQRFSNAVAAHMHEWTYQSNPETGEWEAKCGPPLRKNVRLGKNGQTKVTYDRIKFKDDEGNQIDDNHSHQMSYMGSQKISQATVNAIRENNVAAIGKATGLVDKSEPTKQVDGFSMSSADSGRTVE